jgi:hypothetical protein
MMIVMTAVCVTGMAAAAVWFTPLRPVVLRLLADILSRFQFSCKVQLLADESRPAGEELVFCVQMIGKVPVPHDHMDTDVSVEMADITDSRFEPDPVLSTVPMYRCGSEPEFHFIAHNGIIPNKHTAIYPWKTVVSVPAHRLRFARRGRRKLLVKVAVVSCENAEVIVSDQKTIEYVFCSDGYNDLRDRKMEVLKASITLAALTAGPDILDNGRTRPIFHTWLDQVAQAFPTAMELAHWVPSLQCDESAGDQAIESLLAYALQADKLAAVELALRVFASAEEMTARQFADLSDIAARLEIKQTRFLALCQKALLFSGCRLEAPAMLLGIDSAMGETTFRARLNEEYRKWNARVTHPDEQIRFQADRMLSFIADLRSGRTVAADALKAGSAFE